MKTKNKVKARKMWGGKLLGREPLQLFEKPYDEGGERAFFVLPATAEAYEQMVNQVGPQIQRWLNGYALPTKYPTVAHAALAAIGITTPTK